MKLTGGYTNYGQDIGILMLDTIFPRIPGDIGNALSYPFPVRYKVVKDAFCERIMGDQVDEELLAPFIKAAQELEAEGCKTVMLPGVTSFCAAAARLGQSLTGGMEQPLTIAPGRCAAEVLAAPGAKVLMKSGRQLPETLAALADAGLLSRSAMVCNCGLPNEEVWPDLADYDPARSAGYFATILVKEG